VSTDTPFFVWKPQLAIGVALADEEHQRFFEIMNRLYAAMCAGGQPTDLQRIHGDLKAYADTHFAHEEDYLSRIGYPDLSVQKIQHARFVADLDVLAATSSPASKNALAVMKYWLLEHILGTDRDYAKWIAEQQNRRATG
jgi:hemerythrin